MAELQVGIRADTKGADRLIRKLKEIRRATGQTATSLNSASAAATKTSVSLQTTVSASGALATSQNLAAAANIAVAKTLNGVAVKATQTAAAESIATKATNTLSAAFARMQAIGSSAFLTVGASAKRFGLQMRTAAATTVGASTAAVGLGATLAIGLGTGIKSAVEFEKTLSRVEGLVGVARGEVEAFKKPLLDIGKATAKGPTELAEALFFVTSAGFKGKDALDVLEASAKAAAAGLGETKDVADAVTSAVNAYGIENLSAAQSTDVLVAAVREGKAAADEIGQAIGQVLPIASQLDVTFDQVGATIAALTRVGLNAAESATALKATLNAISKPGNEAVTTLKKLSVQNLGVEKTFDDVRKVLKEDGLIAALNLLQDATGGNTQELQKIFPNIRAGAGVFSLLGKNAKGVEQIFDRMTDTVGATDKAFEAYKNTTSFELNEALVVLQVSLQKIGEVLLPAVAKAFVTLAGAVEKTVNGMKGLGELVANAVGGSADPATQAREQVELLTAAIENYESRVNFITKGALAVGGVDVGLTELSGTYDENLAKLRESLEKWKQIVEQNEKEQFQAIKVKDALVEVAEVVDEISKTPSAKVIDPELLAKGQKNLADLREEVAFLEFDLTHLQELGQEGIGLAEDFFTTKEIVGQLQGEVAGAATKVRQLVNDKRALADAINAINEEFIAQEAATKFLDDLVVSTTMLQQKFAALSSGGTLIDVSSLQEAQRIFDDLSMDEQIGRSPESIQQEIMLQEALNKAIAAIPVDKVKELATLQQTLLDAQSEFDPESNAFAQLGAAADQLGTSIVNAQLAAEGLTGIDQIMLNALPKEEQFAAASERLKTAFNAAGIVDPNDPRFVAAIDALEKKIFQTTDIFKEFGIQAARNLQSAFADFLFDPFTDGLDGMIRGFSDTLRRMASEVLSQKILSSLLGSFGGGFGDALQGAFAGGGNFSANKPMIVGEEGPEIITPRQSGTVVPNSALMGGGKQAAPQVNVAGPTIVNTLEDGAVVAAFNRGGGSQTILNNMTENRAAFRNALGI